MLSCATAQVSVVQILYLKQSYICFSLVWTHATWIVKATLDNLKVWQLTKCYDGVGQGTIQLPFLFFIIRPCFRMFLGGVLHIKFRGGHVPRPSLPIPSLVGGWILYDSSNSLSNRKYIHLCLRLLFRIKITLMQKISNSRNTGTRMCDPHKQEK